MLMQCNSVLCLAEEGQKRCLKVRKYTDKEKKLYVYFENIEKAFDGVSKKGDEKEDEKFYQK